MKNCVTINLKKNEIVIKISEKAEQKEIKECLNKKLTELKKLYKEEKTPIKVTGKVLKNKEIEEIQTMISETIPVEIEFESPKILGLHGIKRAFRKEIKSSDTKFQRGSLRSGQKIEFEGSIVIIGDVNAGAEVIASENIIVLGNLRGLAHAGAKGNKEAIVAANKIECPQIRISNKIKEIERPEEEEIDKSYAYISSESDEIILE